MPPIAPTAEGPLDTPWFVASPTPARGQAGREPAGTTPFRIDVASSGTDALAAGALVQRRYVDRGYRCSVPAPSAAHELTLVANQADATIGTLTIGFDNPTGLHIDDVFRAEADALRAAGSRICEFTKLALDRIERSAHVLASLFETAYLYAHRVMGFDKLLIEVNPRHVRYYERMYGFVVIGGARQNDRVEAPAVLMCLDLAAVGRRLIAICRDGEVETGDRALQRYHAAIADLAVDGASPVPAPHPLVTGPLH